MKFKIHQGVLHDLLKNVMPAVDNKGDLPSLGCVRISANNNTITLDSMSRILTLRAVGAAEVSEQGCWGVSGQLLLNLISILPAEDVEFSVSKEAMLKIKCNNKTVSIKLMSEDSLRIPPNYEMILWSPVTGFFGAFNKVSHCIGDDETRVVLTCATIRNNFIVATDGHRLAIQSLSFPIQTEVNILGDIITKLKRVFSDEDFHVGISDNCIYFRNGDRLFSSLTLINKEYPNIDAIIPKTPYDIVKVNIKDLVSTLKMIRLVEVSAARKAKFEFSPGVLKLTGESIDVGIAEESIPCECDINMMIFLNAEYMLNALEKIDADVVEFHLRPNGVPVMIMSDKLTQIVMPMR